MMTSAAETPSPLWMSVGMPRPSSRTVQEPSGLRVTTTSLAIAGERLVDGVVDHLVDHVVEAGAVIGVADIHARPLAHRVEALEDLDRIRVVIGGDGRSLAGGFGHGGLSNQAAKNGKIGQFDLTRKARCRTGQTDRG